MYRALLVLALAVLVASRPPAADAQVRAEPESSTCGITFSMSNSAKVEVSVRITAGEGPRLSRDRVGVVFVPAGGTATYEWRAPQPCGTYWHYGFQVGIMDYSSYSLDVPSQGATAASTSATRVDLGDVGGPWRRRGRLDIEDSYATGPWTLFGTRAGYRTLFRYTRGNRDFGSTPLDEVDPEEIRAPGTTHDIEYLGGDVRLGSEELWLGDWAWFRLHLPDELGERFTILLSLSIPPPQSTLLFKPVAPGAKERPTIPGFREGAGHHLSVSAIGTGLGVAPDEGSGLAGQASWDVGSDGRFSEILSFEVDGEDLRIYHIAGYDDEPRRVLASRSPVTLPRTSAIDFYYEARPSDAKAPQTPVEDLQIYDMRVATGTAVPDLTPANISLDGEWQRTWTLPSGAFRRPELDPDGTIENGVGSELNPAGTIEDGVRIRVSDGEGRVSRMPAGETRGWVGASAVDVGFVRWKNITPAGDFEVGDPSADPGEELRTAIVVMDGPDRLMVVYEDNVVVSEVWERVGSAVTDSEDAIDADASLQGTWVRRDSNNPRNDGMRVELDGADASLTYLPPAGSRLHQVGQVQWRDVTGPGAMRVRGSDGGYYDAQLTMEGPDRLHIDIESNGPGNDQTWVRGGPSYDGEWVLARSTDGRNEGLRIQVAGDRGIARFLPPTAVRGLRVGSSVWSGIAADGSLEAIGGAGDLADASLSLEHEDVLRVRLESGEVQLWVRADALDGLPDGLLDDLAGGGAPDLENAPETPDDTREVDIPDAEPRPATACAAPSSPEPAGPTSGWRWTLDAPILPDGSAPGSDEMPPGEMSIVVDIDRSFASGAPPHFSTISLPGPRYARAFRSERDLTSAELDAAVTSARDAGEVISNLEVYETDAGLRHAAVFRIEPRGFAWSAQPGLTRAGLEGAVETRASQGYRIADLEAYPTSEGTRFAAIWYRTCDATAWSHAVDVDGPGLQAMRDSLANQGFQLTDIEPYAAADGTRYAALWEPVPADRGWEVHWDQGLTWFLNFHRRYVDQGMRLFDYEAFETPDGVRYAGIWVEHDARYDFVARDSIRAVIERHVRDNDLPGTSVAVIRDGEVLYRGGVGWADREEDKTAHSGTVYLAASVSKAFGGTLAALLEERGEIDLSQPTGDYVRQAYTYVPTLPQDLACTGETWAWACEDMPDHHTHTVEQLLAKTACIHHHNEGPRPPPVYYRWRGEALTEIWNAPLLSGCVPGADYHYSTYGFTYAGAALEAVTGLSMASLIRYELAEPLGLSSLRAMYDADDLPADYERARPYALANRDSLPHPQRNPSGPTIYSNNSWKILGGGLEMNALDLAAFGWKTLNGEVVSPTVRDDRLWASLTDSATVWADTLNGAAPAVGLGWRVDNADPSARRAWHHGSWRGARSHLEIWRDEGLVVAIMSNRRDDDVRSILDLADDIREMIRRLDP